MIITNSRGEPPKISDPPKFVSDNRSVRLLRYHAKVPSDSVSDSPGLSICDLKNGEDWVVYKIASLVTGSSV